MQLGTRWAIRQAPPARLPDAIRDAVASVEAELATTDAPWAEWHWTLTYLEGRAVLDLDDGTRIKALPDGGAVVTDADLDEAADDEQF